MCAASAAFAHCAAATIEAAVQCAHKSSPLKPRARCWARVVWRRAPGASGRKQHPSAGRTPERGGRQTAEATVRPPRQRERERDRGNSAQSGPLRRRRESTPFHLRVSHRDQGLCASHCWRPPTPRTRLAEGLTPGRQQRTRSSPLKPLVWRKCRGQLAATATRQLEGPCPGTSLMAAYSGA